MYLNKDPKSPLRFIFYYKKWIVDFFKLWGVIVENLINHRSKVFFLSRIDWCQRNSDPISKSSCFQPIQIPVLTKGDRFRQLFGEGSENAPNHYIYVKFYAWSIGDTLISWFEDLSKSYEILKSCQKTLQITLST